MVDIFARLLKSTIMSADLSSQLPTSHSATSRINGPIKLRRCESAVTVYNIYNKLAITRRERDRFDEPPGPNSEMLKATNICNLDSSMFSVVGKI